MVAIPSKWEECRQFIDKELQNLGGRGNPLKMFLLEKSTTKDFVFLSIVTWITCYRVRKRVTVIPFWRLCLTAVAISGEQ